MNIKVAILAVLIFGVFLIGCSQKADYTGYASNQQQNPQQGQTVGGGCGVLPNSGYVDNSGVLDSTKPML